MWILFFTKSSYLCWRWLSYCTSLNKTLQLHYTFQEICVCSVTLIYLLDAQVFTSKHFMHIFCLACKLYVTHQRGENVFCLFWYTKDNKTQSTMTWVNFVVLTLQLHTQLNKALTRIQTQSNVQCYQHLVILFCCLYRLWCVHSYSTWGRWRTVWHKYWDICQLQDLKHKKQINIPFCVFKQNLII